MDEKKRTQDRNSTNAQAMSETEPNGSSYRDSAGNGSAETETETRETALATDNSGGNVPVTVAMESGGSGIKPVDGSIATRFPPGVSGNPKGRPPGSDSLEHRIRKATGDGDELVALALRVIRGQQKGVRWRHPAVVLRALEWLADRAYGRPQVSLDTTGISSISINIMGPATPEASSSSSSTATETDTVQLQITEGSFFSEKE